MSRWTYIEPVMRTAVQTFAKLSDEQRALLRREMHLLFFGLEDLQEILSVTDDTRAEMMRQKESLERALKDD